MLVIKDFTVMLSLRPDDIAEIWGQFRNAFDGTARRNDGTGKDTFYESKFGVIACVTDVLDSHQKLVSQLGERFISYRMPRLSEHERFRRTTKAAEGDSLTARRSALRSAAMKVLASHPSPAVMFPDAEKQLVLMAEFLASARTWVPRNRQHEIIALPDPEVPTRIVKQLASLACGVAMARGKSEVGQSEINLMKHLAIDSIPVLRSRILEVTAAAGPDGISVDETATKLALAPLTVRYAFQDMRLLNILTTREVLTPNGIQKSFWILKPKYRSLWLEDEYVRHSEEEERVAWEILCEAQERQRRLDPAADGE